MARGLIALLWLLAVPAAGEGVASATPWSPDQLVPGRAVRVELGFGWDQLAGERLRLSLNAPRGFRASIETDGRIAVDAAGRARATLRIPRTYKLCATAPDLICHTHAVFPGLRVSTSACTSLGRSGPDFAYVGTAELCRGLPARFGLRWRVRRPVRLRSPVRVRGARWRGWRSGVARARTARGILVARDIVDCDGRLWYSTLDVRRGARRVARYRYRAPCSSRDPAQARQQVYRAA